MCRNFNNSRVLGTFDDVDADDFRDFRGRRCGRCGPFCNPNFARYRAARRFIREVEDALEDYYDTLNNIDDDDFYWGRYDFYR